MSHLRLQSVLYLAHVFHLAEMEAPLIEGGFLAGNYGPIAPKLYRRVKRFSANSIQNAFYDHAGAEKGTAPYKFLSVAYEGTKERTSTYLVGITRQEGGAWQKVYKPGGRWVAIPDALILQDDRDRIKDTMEEKAADK